MGMMENINNIIKTMDKSNTSSNNTRITAKGNFKIINNNNFKNNNFKIKVDNQNLILLLWKPYGREWQVFLQIILNSMKLSINSNLTYANILSLARRKINSYIPIFTMTSKSYLMRT